MLFCVFFLLKFNLDYGVLFVKQHQSNLLTGKALIPFIQNLNKGIFNKQKDIL